MNNCSSARIKSLSFCLFLFLAPAFWAAQLPPEQVSTDFRRLLEKGKVPLDPTVTSTEEKGFAVERGSFASTSSERIPFVIVRPANSSKSLPIVIALHGTGGNKESQLPLLRELAAKG